MKYINKEKLEQIKLTRENFCVLIDFDKTITTYDSLDSWDVAGKAADKGCVEEISNLYNKISGIDSLNLLYISQYKNFSKDELKKIYKKNLSKDLLIGKTCIGIHHDDFIFQTSFGNLKDYGSEGQQKNAIIAYKLAEISLFKLIKGYYPILILDDLFSELDENKIKNIYSLLVGNMQIFITTTNIMFISSEIKEKSKVFKIISGKVEEEN